MGRTGLKAWGWAWSSRTTQVARASSRSSRGVLLPTTPVFVVVRGLWSGGQTTCRFRSTPFYISLVLDCPGCCFACPPSAPSPHCRFCSPRLVSPSLLFPVPARALTAPSPTTGSVVGVIGLTTPASGTFNVTFGKEDPVSLSARAPFTSYLTFLFFRIGLDPSVTHEIEVLNTGSSDAATRAPCSSSAP